MAPKEGRPGSGRGKSYAGTYQDVATIVARHLEKPKLLQYDQRTNSRIQRDALLPWRDMWRELHALQENMSFPLACLHQAMHQVAMSKGFFKK